MGSVISEQVASRPWGKNIWREERNESSVYGSRVKCCAMHRVTSVKKNGPGADGGEDYDDGEETRPEELAREEERTVAVHGTIRSVRTGHVTAPHARGFMPPSGECRASLESPRTTDRQRRASSCVLPLFLACFFLLCLALFPGTAGERHS